MLRLLWLIPAFPLLGFVALFVTGGHLPRRTATLIGVGTTGLAAICSLLVGAAFLASPPGGHAYVQTLWRWMAVSGFSAEIAFYLDPLSLVMATVIVFVAFLIHIYSAEFMADAEGYSRFFAGMNLFAASMLILVLADNLLLLFLGWEGVGLCSYLLIGFSYRDPANGLAARKAFVITRVGDTAMAIGLILLFTQLGTLDIQELVRRATAQWPTGSGIATAAVALLLAGALGKSAQLPLQTWLPDAMAGPTPASALIHAATMVTAGVYLIARTHALFALAPAVQSAVAIIGAATLLLAGFSALVQSDIKRVLAYSTMSQVGYMFLALGVGAWWAAIFHFMTHAFFKALLFLCAGVVILAQKDEHDIFRMGGLRRELPVAFWTFLAGGASLAGLPLVTAGFYSKDEILRAAWVSGAGSPWLWAAGWAGTFITALYVFRTVFLVFLGELKTPIVRKPGFAMTAPLIILAILSLVAGFLEMPATLGDFPLFSSFLSPVLPAPPGVPGSSQIEAELQFLAAAASLAGIFLAYWLFLRKPDWFERLAAISAAANLHRLWQMGWGFDWLYDRLLVRPCLWIAEASRKDFVDRFYDAIAGAMGAGQSLLTGVNELVDGFYGGIVWLARFSSAMLSRSQTGEIRRYAAAIAAGSVIIVGLALWT